MKVKIVSDGHGHYAVQKKFLFWTYYLDLRSDCFWWTKRDRFFKDCWGTKEQAEMWAARVTLE